MVAFMEYAYECSISDELQVLTETAIAGFFNASSKVKFADKPTISLIKWIGVPCFNTKGNSFAEIDIRHDLLENQWINKLEITSGPTWITPLSGFTGMNSTIKLDFIDTQNSANLNAINAASGDISMLNATVLMPSALFVLGDIPPLIMTLLSNKVTSHKKTSFVLIALLQGLIVHIMLLIKIVPFAKVHSQKEKLSALLDLIKQCCIDGKPNPFGLTKT